MGNFIDKTFTVIADILLKVLPASKQEKQAFSYYRAGMAAQGKGRYAEALQNYYEALQIEEDPYDRSYTLYNYKYGMEGTTVFQNDRYLVCFNQTTGDLISGDKQRPGTIKKLNKTNRIGSQKWIDKWSKK